MSDMFPDLVEFLLKLDLDNLIIEGEAIGWDPNSGKFLPFQETVKRKRKHLINDILGDIPLRFFAFDILYLNGKSLLNYIHKDRRRYLTDIIPSSLSPVIQVIDELYCSSSNDIADYFNEQIINGFEGLILKNINSVYKPGKRSNNWIKLKKVRSASLNDTIDCVILGYYFGKGRRVEFEIGAFLVGIYNRNRDRFETVAKIGTGLKDQDWIDLKSRLDKIVLKDKPYNVYCNKELYPDVWVEPSIIVVVLADEITQSPLHTALKDEEQQGYALRFPRFVSYVYDKDIYQITDESELKSLYKMQFERPNIVK
jgi:DNA ligase-1